MRKKYIVYKFLSLLIFFAFAFGAKAATYYWVGNGGLWNDANHWAAVSGGNGGAGVPGTSDNVLFDKNSFTNPNEVVTITGTAYCHSLLSTDDAYYPVIKGSASTSLEIYGSLYITPEINWQFSGAIHFKANGGTNTINPSGRVLNNDVYFEGSGSWQLTGFLMLGNSNVLNIVSGTLHSGRNSISCGTLGLQGIASKVLDINNGILFIKNKIDSATSSRFTLQSNHARIYYKNYSDVKTFAALNNPLHPPKTPAIIKVDTTVIRPSCNCNDTAGSSGLGHCCNGKIVITKVHATDSGGFSYNWSTGATVDSIVNVCASLNSVSCTILDSSDFSSITVIINVAIPQIIIPVETSKPPRCNGQCNGWIVADISGGTPNYSYNWSAGSPGSGSNIGRNTNFIDSALCVVGVASNFTLKVTDAHNCFHKFTYPVTQPRVINVTVTNTNVDCFGDCNATATVTNTTGGHGSPYTYKWSTVPIQTNATATGLCVGTYTVTAFDDSNCTGTASVTITQPQPLVMNPTQVNVDCNGNCNGQACVSPTGGTPAYTYLWSPGGQTTACITGLCAGTYKVHLTDAHGCKDSASFTITQPTPLVVTLSKTNVDCFGNCDGKGSVTVSGGTSPYTYLWSNGNTTTQDTGLCAGNYWVKVVDAHNCPDSIAFTITQPTQITFNDVVYNVKCNTFCTGAIDADPSGGTPPYTYTWSNGATVDSIGALCAGTYTLLVKDAHGCKDSLSVTITQPPPISINITSTNISCHNSCDGSATANVSGGTPGYTYLWAPSARTTQTITGLCAGSYTVTVHDANGCVATAAVTITQPNALTVSLTANPNPLNCFGDCNATISSTVSGGTAPYTYLWKPGNQITPVITNQCAGTYKLVVTDAHGCKDSATVIVREATQLRDSITAVTNVKCAGTSTGSATVGVRGGTPAYTYLWTPTGQTTPTAINLSVGCYTVTVTDNHGCTASASVCITQPPPLAVSLTDTNEKCNGDRNAKITANVSGGVPGYTYTWAPGGQTTATITGLSVGCYTVTVKDANNCTVTASACITQPPPLSAVITSTTSSCNICDGSAKVTVSGGTLPYTYSWTTLPVQTTDSATGLCVGTYTVTVKDADGCTATASATIVPTVQITVTTSSNTVSCDSSCDGVATANPSGGSAPYTYLWMPGGQTTQTATGLCAGTYTVNVHDVNGCSTVDSVKFINPPKLVVTITHNNATCVGKCDGSATANASGGTPPYTYQWSNGATTSSITNLCVGMDTVTVTDSHGCIAKDTVTINSNGSLNDNPTITSPTCGNSNGSITLNPSGGTSPYTYLWGGGQTTPTITGLSAGTYTVNITDAAGCTKQFLIPLSNVSGPTLSATSTKSSCGDTCDGTATVTVTGGSAPFTYLWSNGATSSTVVALCPGVYSCSVTDVNGCVTVITDTVKKPVPINPNPVVQQVSCNGQNNGKITLNTTGGTSPYTYTWSNGNTTSSSSGLSQGTYTIKVMDNVGCDTTITINITQPAPLTVTITSTNIKCFGDSNGTATANVSGGTFPYIYNWSNGGVVASVVNLAPGTYTVTVTDVHGCTASASVTITQPAVLTGNITSANVTCNGSSNGSATANISGGTQQYTYSWSNGATTSSISPISVGTYYLTVTDSNGCSFLDSVKITAPPPINITFTSTNALCSGDCNGTATANVTGGSSPYTYLWNPGGQTNQTATGLCPGTYTVDVTDANGCPANNNVTITAPQPLNANVTVTPTTCSMACNGSASSSPTGGTSPYTYKWSTGQTTSSATNLCAGTDTLVVTDANGCQDTNIFLVPAPAKFTLNVSTSPANCGVPDGSITVTPSGGAPPYTYLWSPGGQTTATVTGLSAGIYQVQITDQNGCDSTFNVLLNNSNGVSSFTNRVKNELCFGDSNGYIVSIPNGGTVPYTYFWANLPPPLGQATDSIYQLASGTYTLQVTDSNGCIQFDTVTVGQPAKINATAAITNAACTGVCTGAISLTTSGGTPGYTYSWAPGGQTTQNITGLCPGADTVNITDANGCTFQKIFTVGMNAQITIAMSFTPIKCSGANTGTAKGIPSGGGGTYTYLWSPGGQTNQTATNLTAGTYTLLVTDQNGCQGTDSVTITAPPAIVISLNNKDISCNNDCDAQSIANISGGVPPYTNHWSNGSTSDTISALCFGTYVDTVRDANGCIAIDSVTFTNPPVLNVTSTVSNASCNTTPDGNITLIVTGGVTPYTFSWSNGATTQNLVNVLPGRYVVSVTDSTGCVVTDTIMLPSDTTVLAEAGPDTSFCASSATITLNGTKSINSLTYEWFQLPGLTPVGNTAVITIAAPPIGTTKYLLVTKQGTCADSDTVAITINPPPAVDAGPTQSIFAGGNVTIGGSPTGPAGSTFHWAPPTGLSGDTLMTNPVASPSVTITYTVTVVTPFGCIGTDTVTVFVYPPVFIPDGFTPNGDGQNDVWHIRSIDLFPNATVEVFNRWGEQLFYSAGYKTPWDGTYNNQPLPVGTYYYVINLNDPRFPKAYTGPVTIMR